jgi:hypothetical protein
MKTKAYNRVAETHSTRVIMVDEFTDDTKNIRLKLGTFFRDKSYLLVTKIDGGRTKNFWWLTVATVVALENPLPRSSH